MQGPLAVVGTGVDKISQNLVGVGGADQLAHGQTQQLCQVACQNVTEVAGGNAEVHFIADLDFAGTTLKLRYDGITRDAQVEEEVMFDPKDETQVDLTGIANAQ